MGEEEKKKQQEIKNVGKGVWLKKKTRKRCEEEGVCVEVGCGPKIQRVKER